MSQYSLDITGHIELGDYSIIEDYIKVVALNDNITISIDDDNSKEVGIICNILQKDKFNINSKGDKSNGKCYIKATKWT